MGRYSIDERVGCIAIIDTDIKADSSGLHHYDNHIVKFWYGINLYKYYGGLTHWHVPNFLKKRAVKICSELNEGVSIETPIEEVYEPTYIDHFKVYFVVLNPDLYEIEITRLTLHDKEIPEYLQTHLLETHEAEFMGEIIRDMKARRFA